MLSEEIKRFLPQYLSSSSKKELFEQLDSFPTDGTKDTIYTSALRNDHHIFQGDGIDAVKYINFPDIRINEVKVLLLSNTCDMSVDNSRVNSCRIMYAPLLNYEKYANFIREQNPTNPTRVEDHLIALKKQYISQALYLPKGGGLEYDALVFFDQAISLPLNSDNVTEIVKKRIFTLSNFGFYLFLLKMSINFTRIQERVDRNL